VGIERKANGIPVCSTLMSTEPTGVLKTYAAPSACVPVPPVIGKPVGPV
jgi:hypothetical protein